MKILFFAGQYPPHVGGVPRFYYQFTKAYNKRDIAVLTSKESGWQVVDENLDFPIYRYGFINSYRTKNVAHSIIIGVALFISMVYVALKEKIGMVIAGASNIKVLSACYFLKLSLGKDYVIFAHGDGDSPHIKCKSDVIKKYLYKRAKAFIANSNFTKDRIVKKYDVDPDMVFVLYPGVDTDRFFPADARDLRKKMGTEGKKVILTASRLDMRKGHDMVLRALPQIIKALPNIIYIIVGRGRQESYLKNLSQELGLDSYVTFVGHATDEELTMFYNLCDLFVMPNRELEGGDTEGFGMVFTEANACGKPVIGGRCGGVVEAIRDHETGLLVDPCDINDIAEKIIYLLKDESIAKELGDKGYKRSVGELEWKINLTGSLVKFNQFLKD